MQYRSEKAKTVSAIAMSAELGQRIQSDHPEVVALYRRLIPLSTIVQTLGLIDGYGVSERIARNAIEYALRGYRWGYGVASYEGLITDAEELQRIRSGYRKKLGRRLKRQKKGICGQSKEEHRKAGYAGAKAVGWIVFTKRERECALRLCADPRFCYDNGRLKGKPKLELVAQELNKRFHKSQSVRTKHSVNFLRGKSKKQRKRMEKNRIVSKVGKKK